MSNYHDLYDKKVAVFGASGNLGLPIVKKLYREGSHVFVTARSFISLRPILEWAADPIKVHPVAFHDLDLCSLDQRLKLPQLSPLDGYVYCIGHCPAHGFDNEVGTPLSEVPLSVLERDLNNHVLHLARVHQYLLGKHLLSRGASIVIIGSAITRLTEDTCPPWLNAWHYIAATAAKETLVRGMRHDPRAKELDLRIHYLAFGAVNTPFHEDCVHRPHELLTIQQVTAEVIEALISDVVVHKHVLP